MLATSSRPNLPRADAASAPRPSLPPGYVPRRPVDTVLHAIVRDHLAAFRADVARALGRIFIEAVALEQRRAAGVARAQHAAANQIQRFGGSLNPNPHFHVIIADGVFVTEDDGRVHFRGRGPVPECDT
ncbi:Hypothetical protein A7982_04206 [Minicystis rosea]|nr:Hypothetical protein A7982_04206 [Minicystis rosea]